MVPSMIRSLVTRLTNSTWLGTLYLVSKFLLNFHNRGVNARMPIQSNQVRGGTLISLPFFSFFPSLCLSSAIIQNVRPKLTRPFPGRNTGFPLQPLPFQSAASLFVELETLSHPQAFHPKQVSRRRGGHNQLMSYGPGNFLVREKVLQFRLCAQANRLKPIARPPMAHQHAR